MNDDGKTDRVERRGDEIPVPRPTCFFCHHPLDSKEHLEHCEPKRGDEEDTEPGRVRHG